MLFLTQLKRGQKSPCAQTMMLLLMLSLICKDCAIRMVNYSQIYIFRAVALKNINCIINISSIRLNYNCYLRQISHQIYQYHVFTPRSALDVGFMLNQCQHKRGRQGRLKNLKDKISRSLAIVEISVTSSNLSWVKFAHSSAIN